jgi:uncharacterized OB-fold protein
MVTEKIPTSVVAPPAEEGGFIRDENGFILPTVENFYTFCADRKLMGVKCKGCGAVVWPPRGICPKCSAKTFEWIQFKGKGNLLTYTIIHFPPRQFQALAPYAVGIIKLEEGPQLPGMIKNLKLEDLRIGMQLQVDFETALPKEWPRWPRYFFKPAS